ncbi:MAG: GDSL-type esterase/lipase family protein [Pirellulales bacterium]
MRAFEEADQAHPTKPGGIVFVGSSTIRLWKLSETFPEPAPLNRGFGGSIYADILPHFDLLIARHQPRIVVVYSGDNDIALGLTPEQVEDDFRQLSNRLREKLPDSRMICLAIKPSRQRWSMYTTMQDANRRLEAICRDHPHRTFLDLGPEMLGKDGQPMPELFQEDGLHLNDRGYLLWSKKLGPLLGPEPK